MGGKSAPVWKRYCHWSTFVIGMTFAIIVCGTFHFHLPLLSSMDDLQRGFPAQDIFEKSRHTENPTPDLIWAGTEVENWQKRIDKELMRIDTEVDAWHKKIWSYRDEIIKQVQLVDMDNEEEASLLKLNCFVYFSISTWIGDLVTLLLPEQFELEISSRSRPHKKRALWLTVHVLAHIALCIFSHIRSSPIPPFLALFSQLILLTVFLRCGIPLAAILHASPNSSLPQGKLPGRGGLFLCQRHPARLPRRQLAGTRPHRAAAPAGRFFIRIFPLSCSRCRPQAIPGGGGFPAQQPESAGGEPDRGRRFRAPRAGDSSWRAACVVRDRLGLYLHEHRDLELLPGNLWKPSAAGGSAGSGRVASCEA